MTIAKPPTRPYPTQRRQRSVLSHKISSAAALLVSVAGLTGVLLLVMIVGIALLAGSVAMAVAAFV